VLLSFHCSSDGRPHTSDQTITKTIYNIIKRGPSVLDEITLNQALGLFVETVQAACDLDPSKTVAIVIDGLDETRRDKLQDTAEIFSQLFKALKRRNAKVFISSRTDDEITKPFYRSLRSNERHVKHVHLDTSDPSSIEDVSRYLFRNVKLLVEKWDLNWGEWPGEERMKMLCVRASGLFIWAVTVVKFFQEQLRQSKHERLNVLLDVINNEGMGDVNQAIWESPGDHVQCRDKYEGTRRLGTRKIPMDCWIHHQHEGSTSDWGHWWTLGLETDTTIQCSRCGAFRDELENGVGCWFWDYLERNDPSAP
jgi:hypothetical protein